MNFKEMIMAHVKEEGEDHDKYMELAKFADEEGYHCEAGVLRDIACEENSHHRLLAEMVGETNPHHG